MKKKLVASLAAAMVLGVAGTSFAAANPFTDVPAKHWAYDSVMKLAQAGVVDGYADGTYRGDKLISRYEMAQMVAKAMAKSDKADAKQKAEIDKLAAEFAEELNTLGVRVSKLEKTAPTIKISGETRARYLSEDSNISNGTSAFDFRQRFHFNSNVNEKISFNARVETVLKNGAASTGTTNANTIVMNRASMSVKDFLGTDKTTFGRQALYVGKTMNVGSSGNNDGVVITKKLGKLDFTGFIVDKTTDNEFYGAYLDTNLSKATDLSVGFTQDHVVGKEAKSTDVGFSSQLGKGFALVGEFVTTDTLGTNNANAYVVQLTKGEKMTKLFPTFNVVNPAKKGTSGYAASYRVIENDALAGQTYGQFSGATAIGAGEVNNVKGWTFGYQNVLQKNTVLTLEYQDLKFEDTGLDKDKTVSAHVQFWF